MALHADSACLNRTDSVCIAEFLEKARTSCDDPSIKIRRFGKSDEDLGRGWLRGIEEAGERVRMSRFVISGAMMQPSQKNRLGRGELDVTPFGFGTAPVGKFSG